MLAFPALVSADAFTALDPRSMSLGGGGAATMRPYNASHFNPARFAGNPRVQARRDDRPFGRFFLGARLIDRDSFLNSLDEYQESNNNDRFDSALEHLQQRIDDQNTSGQDFRDVTNAGNALLDDYESLSDKPLRAAASAGLNVGYPGDQWGIGAHVRQNLAVGMEVRVSESDRRRIRETLNFIDTLVDISETGELPDDVVIPRPVDQFTSEFALQGAMVRDSGVSLAGRIPGNERTMVGVTVKSLYVETVDWRVDVDSADSDNFDFDEHRRAHSDPNLDLGLIHELDEHWTAAIMVRNLISRDYKTVLDNEVRLRPALRGGLAWQTRRWSVSVDMDFNETEAIGFDPAKRYTTVGLEYRPMRWLSLRGGYRYENVLHEGNASLGFGLDSRHAHFDFAVSGDTGDSLGIALQAGTRF